MCATLDAADCGHATHGVQYYCSNACFFQTGRIASKGILRIGRESIWRENMWECVFVHSNIATGLQWLV